MNDAYTIRKCLPEDLPAVQTYIDRFWRKGHILARDRDFLEWQFAAPAGDRAPQILLLMRGEEIMGMRGLIPSPFNLLGRQVPGTWTGNLHCREETRNGGWSLKLMTASHALGFDFIAVIGANERAKGIYKALRYRIIDSLPRAVGITNRAATLGLLRHGHGAGASELALSEQCDRHLVSRERLAQGPADRCVPWEPRWEGAWSSFWRGTASKELIGTDRDASYLNRRYRDHRWFKYGMQVSLSSGGETATGLLVYRVEKIRDWPLSVIRVTELLAFDEAAFRALIGKMLDVAAQEEAAFCDFFCSTPSLLDALGRYGIARCAEGEGVPAFPARFQPLDFKQTKIAGAVRPSKEILATLGADWMNHLYVTKSDGDQDRPV